ncbi:hypothetical protein RHSIM_Rhsim08G0182000 [Rhododendron simsii]|uniref:3-beta hydroxysteroid dehydrogenase/isomerase domain-containing protein n=1 Tax=Rhododendron simsii TaxID=118357 RepID=A0A834GHJ5_RHOSS|nr:hypothetical protein RHSIM_Rhsim08G0182000 [Rhododendron simsii]
MSGAGKVVCVTGGVGLHSIMDSEAVARPWLLSKAPFAASHRWMTQRQLTAVLHRSSMLGDPKKMDHLLSLHGAKERLQLFEANLMEEGSFDSVLDGCEGVFPTASPVFSRIQQSTGFAYPYSILQDELIKPAVKGTQNVLGSCAKIPSVERVVLTSSIASVAFNSRPRNPDVVIDEMWFSDPVYCEESKVRKCSDILYFPF